MVLIAADEPATKGIAPDQSFPGRRIICVIAPAKRYDEDIKI